MAVSHDKCCRCRHCNRRRRGRFAPGSCETCFARPAVGTDKKCAECASAVAKARAVVDARVKLRLASETLSDRELESQMRTEYVRTSDYVLQPRA